MSVDSRKNPDTILKTLHEEMKSSKEAKLRVFLGMSAGVGKTYSMLRAAKQKMNEGVDVLVGLAVTHDRAETKALLEGLPLLPLKKIEHRGTFLEELDLDEILRRKPKLVIIDELAHTNAPGSRHRKRYQDILEILEAGIDVYTALNVQHLESRKESVESIVQIPIRETVPDSILERASLVELVDIAPSELLKRLKEGKVYLGEKADRAADNFFKEDRLTALREMALRITAERVDRDLQRFAESRSETSPWQTNERLLVAVSHSPFSEKLIRAARRLAYNLDAPWIAVHVETGLPLNDSDQAQLIKNLNLARELKAEVITTTEVDIPSALQRICRSKNVTQVIVGRPTQRRLRDFLEGGTLLDHLVRESVDVDVHVLRQEQTIPPSPFFGLDLLKYKSNTGPIKYWFTFCFIAAIGFLSGFIQPLIGYRAVGFLFLLAVLIVGLFGSVGAVVFSALLSAVAWNFFFIPPILTFAISAPDDIILCFSFFVVALITGFLTQRIRFHERLIREREERTNFLYEILQDIANSQEKSEFLEKVTRRVGLFLKADCGVVLKSEEGDLVFDDVKAYAISLSEKDRAVALWAFQNGKLAGWSTETLSQSKALYIPLKGQGETVGLFIFQPHKKIRKVDLEQGLLLSSVTRQLGISIERHFLSKRLIAAQRLQDSEKLHQTLLNSISHEMRTPLTAILGTASALEERALAQNPEAVMEVGRDLQEAGNRLNRVIENLLDMSRLNSGVLSLHLEWHDLNDLVGVVAQKNAKILSKHILKIHGLEEISLVKMDFRLMEHALSNLLLNATLYTPAGSTIQIVLRKESEKMILRIEDDGPGIPEDAKLKVFDKFYRLPGSPPGGTGLGLSIVKSIIELHGGKIFLEEIKPHGACFRIELSIKDRPELPTEEKP